MGEFAGCAVSPTERIATWLGWVWDYANDHDPWKLWLTKDGKPTNIAGFGTLDACRIFENQLADQSLSDRYAIILWEDGLRDIWQQPHNTLAWRYMQAGIFATPAQRVAACIKVLDEISAPAALDAEVRR